MTFKKKLVQPPYDELKDGDELTITFKAVYRHFNDEDVNRDQFLVVQGVVEEGQIGDDDIWLNTKDITEVHALIEEFEPKKGDVYKLKSGVYEVYEENGELYALIAGITNSYLVRDLNFTEDELIYRKNRD